MYHLLLNLKKKNIYWKIMKVRWYACFFILHASLVFLQLVMSCQHCVCHACILHHGSIGETLTSYQSVTVYLPIIVPPVSVLFLTYRGYKRG